MKTLFDVSNVTPASKPLGEIPYHQAVANLLTKPVPNRSYIKPQSQTTPKKIEACSSSCEQLVDNVYLHPVIAAIHLAFSRHRPLCLSPDIIWLLIAQGFANHINMNSEQLRHRLVKHQGKLTLQVRRDDFIKGSMDNRWSEVFTGFSVLIQQHIGKETHEALTAGFSTTGWLEKAALEIVLLDTVKSYFEFDFTTYCGIPDIQLDGTLADWQQLLERTKRLAQFNLDWWINPLLPILEQFIKAVQGQPDKRFWQSIYKNNDTSGGPYISGWIIAFFPYLKDYKTGYATRVNEILMGEDETLQTYFYPNETDDPFHGLTTRSFPNGLASAPFHWRYLEQTYEMEFLAGFVGVRQNPDTLFLRPEIGWAVCGDQ